jgi:hypothetical protein
MRAFEIQTYQDGKWKIDSVFDDRDLALFEARRVDEGSRYAGVRVIEEIYDEVSDLTTTRTIFRGGRAERQERARREAVRRSPTAHAAAEEKESRRRAGRPPPARTSSVLIPVLILTLLVVAGLAGLLGLQQLAQLR